jgi:serine protease Do
MKKDWYRLATGVLALACAGASAQQRPLTPEELYEQIAPSVWLVETIKTDGKGSIGSAVVIAPGTLVTNCHVIDKAQEIAVSHMNRDRIRVRAHLQYRDPSRDLCQIQASVIAPSVTIAPPESLRTGAKVYAIGNPRGLELTISDGLVSGLRRDNAGVLQRVQMSVPISPGSSGGGLFDVYGRLIGITTSYLGGDAQNLNFALPAHWIAELGPRSRGEPATNIAGRTPPRAAPEAPPGAAPQPAEPTVTARVFEYQLRDRVTGMVRPVIFRVDRVEGEKLVINGGSRVEQTDGRVVSDSALIGGEFDAAMPPGGWIHEGNVGERTWSSTYRSTGDGRPFTMQIRAETAGEDVMLVKGKPLRTVRVRYKGFTTRGGGIANNPPGAYTATAWYAPQLGRVVRFEARSRGGLGHTAFVVDEVLELVDFRTE